MTGRFISTLAGSILNVRLGDYPAMWFCLPVSVSELAMMYSLRRFAVEIGQSLKSAEFAGTNRIGWISMTGSSRSLGSIGLKAGAIASNGESDAEEQHQDRSFSIRCSGLFILPNLFTSAS